MDLSAVSGKRILLKPNVGRVAEAESGVNTNPQVVAAAIDAFREAGAEVAIGESPIIGVDLKEAFDVLGMTAVAAERDCPLIDMDVRPFVATELPEGRAIKSLKVCPEVFEFDFVVSIPVMKTHMHTGATLSVKNMKGCLWRKSKAQLHMLPPVGDGKEKSINVAIADMSAVVRADLAIVDGTVGMEGLGPSDGAAKPMDVVLARRSPFAADAVACQLMGTSAERIPHLRMGAERGYGVIDMDRIVVTPDGWNDWISPFSLPPENLTIQFPNITVLDNNSCSACQSTLLLFLKKFRDQLFDYFPAGENVNIAIGKGHEELPEGTLCIGNCTARHRKQGIFVPGCPPVGSQILAALDTQSKVDETECRGKPGEDES